MTTPRDLVLQSLNFQPTPRIPKDLGGMRSTSISAFAYPKLVAALGLPPRRPRVEDTGQMLALPDLDVLTALGCDVVTILDGVTNALPPAEQAHLWHDYDFNGRLPAQVRWPQNFVTLPDVTILQHGRSRMVPASYVFDEEHGGQPLDLSADLPKLDLNQFRREAQATLPLGTVDDVRREVAEVTRYMGQDGGYVFCNIHNILAEIAPEKVIAMYEEASRA